MEKFEKLRHVALPMQIPKPDETSFAVVAEHESSFPGTCDSNSVLEGSPPYGNGSDTLKFDNFAEKIISLDDKQLNRVLEDIDVEHRVSIHDLKTEEVVTATETLVTGILYEAGEIDPRFRSSCIYSGSFYDDLKVGNADEFDFVARIDSLSHKGLLEARHSKRKRGFVYLIVKDERVQDEFKEFLTSPDDDPCLKDTDVILCVSAFQDYFIELLFSAIKLIDIPDNFIPATNLEDGEVTASSWRPHRHGPCATLYLTYICQATSDVVNLDIDIAPSIAYPGVEYKPPVMEKLSDILPSNTFLNTVRDICNTTEVMLVPFHFDYTKQTPDKTWSYHYSDTWRVSHSSLEKAIFALFKPSDTEKKMCRILKILKEIYLQGTFEIEQESGSGVLKRQEPPSTRLTNVCVEEIQQSSDDESESETDADSQEYVESDNQTNDDFEVDMVSAAGDKWETVEAEDHTAEETVIKYIGNDMEKAENTEKSLNYEDYNQQDDSCHKCTFVKTKNFKTISAIQNTLAENDNTSHNFEITYDQTSDLAKNVNTNRNFEIIYDRKSTVSSKAGNSTNITETTLTNDDHFWRTSYREETLKDESKYDRAKSFNKRQESNCSKTRQGLNETKQHLQFIDPSSSISTAGKQSQQRPSTSDVLSHPLTGLSVNSPNTGDCRPDPSQQQHQFSLDTIETAKGIGQPALEINYRSSQPLLKTYMIKMLFLAMKTAYPDSENWEPEQLSSLLKMALCMIYYAYNSQEKGILNFWFQEHIENRTRDSTCREVLYCLERVVQILERKGQYYLHSSCEKN